MLGSTPATPASTAAYATDENAGRLALRLSRMHDELQARIPAVDRIACIVYSPEDDMLRPYADSTRHGTPMGNYAIRLSEVPSLRQLARERDMRVIDQIPDAIAPRSAHSRWLLEQGYQSSFTAPLHDRQQLLGFVFYNARQPHAFDAQIQRDLILWSSLVNIAIITNPGTVSPIVVAAHVARDFTDLRDFEIGAHLDRMARYAHLIASYLAPTHGLSAEFVDQIYLFARLHDIGKIGIPDEILRRPGPLSAEERALMQGHVSNGLAIVDQILHSLDGFHPPDAQLLRDIVGCHHELLDGSGYPHGLAGDAISLAARIATVADIFDALTSPRSYKRAWTVDAALDELRRMVGHGKLDGDCVAALAAARPEAEEILRQSLG